MPSQKEKFLNYYKDAKSKATYKSYKRSLSLFKEWYGKDADTILKERTEDVASGDITRVKRFSRELEKFHKWMLEKGYSINTARVNTLGLIQFLRFYGMPITDVTFKTVPTTKTYIPSIEQLRAMFQIANLRERIVLSLGLDLAWRISDFVPLKKEDIPDLNQKTPIPFEAITTKEQILSSTFISTETVELLKVYIPTLPKENPYLFPSNRHTHLDDESVNKTLKKLCEKAKLKIPQNKRFTFHSIRKRFLSTCYNLGIDHEISKLLVGKSIGQSIETYLGDVKLRDAFTQVREQALSLTNMKAKTEVEMKDIEIANLRTEVEKLRLTMKGMLELYGEELMQKAIEKLKAEGQFRIDAEPLEMLERIGKATEKKQKREYEKLLKETNGFNHET
jgi:integrase